jgi:hypothetical protein
LPQRAHAAIAARIPAASRSPTGPGTIRASSSQRNPSEAR